MIEIKRMFHKKTGEIIFEDINGQWWVQEYQFNDISVGNQGEWLPVVVTKIEKPKELKEWFND